MRSSAMGLALMAVSLGGCLHADTSRYPATGTFKPVVFPAGPEPAEVAVAREVRNVDETIDEGRDSGDLSRKQSRRLRKAAARLGQAADAYAMDGVSEGEARDVGTYARAIESQAEAARFVNDPE